MYSWDMVYEEIRSWDICSCLSASRGASSEWSNGQKKEMVRRPTRLLAKRHDFWIFFLCKILLHATPWCHVDKGIFNLDKAHISDGLMAIGCKDGARSERGKEALFHETTFYSSLRKNLDIIKKSCRFFWDVSLTERSLCWCGEMLLTSHNTL